MADYDNVMRKIDYLDDTKQQIKDAIIEKGQQIEDDDPFREYVDKIKELSTGDIRLFNTIEEMNSDQKPKKDGDLAVVYNKTFAPLLVNSTFGAIIIPKVIHLGSISEQNRTFYAYNNVNSLYGEIYATIPGYNPETSTTISNMNIELRNSKQRIILNYIGSDDGLTYTFDMGRIIDNHSGVINELIFDTDELYFNFETNINVQEFDEVFSGIFNISKLDFQGLFRYTLNNLKEHTVYYGNNPHINPNQNEILIIDLVDWLDYGLFAKDIYTLSNKVRFSGITVVGNVENHIPHELTVYYDTRYLLRYNDTLYIEEGSSYSDKTVADEYASTHTYTYGKFDFINWTYQEYESNYQVVECINNDKTMYYIVLNETLTNDMYITNYSYNSTNGGYANQDIVLNEDDNLYWYSMPYAYIDKYVIAPNQLTLSNVSELITNISALGNNGIYTGDGSFISRITTKEYKDYFIPELPDTLPSTTSYSIQNGVGAKYFTLVEREKLKCDEDISVIPSKDTLKIIIESEEVGNITSTTYDNAYNAEYHRTFYTKNDNKLYYGYFGYNMSDKQSGTSSGATTHEEFYQIYGILVCLDDISIVKEVNYTTTWRPFAGYGNTREDPNANVVCLNYDFTNDEFIIFVDTGNWGWPNDNAPYVAMMKLNGTTGEATTKSWKIGRNGAPYKYLTTYDLRYDITTQSIIVPIYSWEADTSNRETGRIIKMDLNGNKTVWIQNGYELDDYDYLSGENSFYISEPIYYYTYVDSSKNKHYVLKRIDDDRTLEIPKPYSLLQQYRIIYNENLYYISDTKLDDDTYPLIKVDLNNMTHTQYNTCTSRSAKFIFVDNIPHITYNNRIYSLDNLVDEKYVYYNTTSMYNDVRVDGVINDNGNIKGTYPKISANESNITFTKNKQQLYHWKIADTFPVHNDLCMVYPSSFGTNLVSGAVNMSQSIVLASVDYTGTIDPFEYQKALETAIKIEGKSGI